jgi:excisionase family DNA binding protein
MKLLTVRQVADFINAKPSTIYSWAEQRMIPCFKLYGLLRFAEDDIQTWINNCKKVPAESYNTFAGKKPKKGG